MAEGGALAVFDLGDQALVVALGEFLEHELGLAGVVDGEGLDDRVPGSKLVVECTGPAGAASKRRKIKADGSAKVKVKGLSAGVYTCSVTRLKDASGATLCRGAVRPVSVIIE